MLCLGTRSNCWCIVSLETSLLLRRPWSLDCQLGTDRDLVRVGANALLCSSRMLAGAVLASNIGHRLLKLSIVRIMYSFGQYPAGSSSALTALCVNVCKRFCAQVRTIFVTRVICNNATALGLGWGSFTGAQVQPLPLGKPRLGMVSIGL